MMPTRTTHITSTQTRAKTQGEAPVLIVKHPRNLGVPLRWLVRSALMNRNATLRFNLLNVSLGLVPFYAIVHLPLIVWIRTGNGD